MLSQVNLDFPPRLFHHSPGIAQPGNLSSVFRDSITANIIVQDLRVSWNDTKIT